MDLCSCNKVRNVLFGVGDITFVRPVGIDIEGDIGIIRSFCVVEKQSASNWLYLMVISLMAVDSRKKEWKDSCISSVLPNLHGT